MSTDDNEELESRLRRYRSVAMTQLVNITRGKMKADLRAYYDRVEAAASNHDVDTKEGWEVIKAACLALHDRLKAWQAEFQKYQLGEDRLDAGCLNTVNEVLSDIHEGINGILEMHNDAALRRIAAIREEERRDIEKSRMELAAFTVKQQKTMYKMNRDFADKARALRKRLR